MTDHSAKEEVIRHEEELELRTTQREIGRIRATKRVDVTEVDERFPRRREDAEIERVAPVENDSGEIETLPDGSVSIPLLEEELVISKRLVVRERIVIHRRTTTEQETVRAELRREQIEIDTRGDVGVDVEDEDEPS